MLPRPAPLHCGLPVLPRGVRQGVGLAPGPPYLRVDSNEALGLGVELLLERDDNGLEVAGRLLLDVVGHLWKGPPTHSRVEALIIPCVFQSVPEAEAGVQGDEILRRGQ